MLVIEDELKLATLIGKALNEQGMPADLASNGEDALQMATASSYDVLLLDVNLPGIDGFEVCRRLRAKGVDTPILMLTPVTGSTNAAPTSMGAPTTTWPSHLTSMSCSRGSEGWHGASPSSTVKRGSHLPLILLREGLAYQAIHNRRRRQP